MLYPLGRNGEFVKIIFLLPDYNPEVRLNTRESLDLAPLGFEGKEVYFSERDSVEDVMAKIIK